MINGTQFITALGAEGEFYSLLNALFIRFPVFSC
jgi:hypothetical protein